MCVTVGTVTTTDAVEGLMRGATLQSIIRCVIQSPKVTQQAVPTDKTVQFLELSQKKQEQEVDLNAAWTLKSGDRRTIQ